MWVTKIKFSGKGAILSDGASKNKISICGYPISYEKSEDAVRVCVVGLLFGEENNKKDFLRDMRAHDRVVNFESTRDFVIGEIVESPLISPMYNYKILHIEPVLIRDDGMEYWTLGSWRKEDLMEFADAAEKNYGAEILSICQKNIDNFSMVSVHPSITDKQKKAMELAILKGYYDYPRKISLDELAKLSGVSFSTFHAHLRKAEQRLLPYLFNRS